MRTDPPEGGWASPEGIAELRRLCAKGSARNHNDRERAIEAMPEVLDALERAGADIVALREDLGDAVCREVDAERERDDARRIAGMLAVVVQKFLIGGRFEATVDRAGLRTALAWAAERKTP